MLDRLHLLVRSDCTTRNRRKAAAQSAAYDELEARIAVLAEEEELGRIRPDLDGNAIMGAARACLLARSSAGPTTRCWSCGSSVGPLSRTRKP